MTNYWRFHTPLMLQMQAIECGATSLGIVLGHFGKFLSLGQLRYECAVTRDGCNALDIIKAARNLDMEASGHRMDIAGLQELKKPAILLWEGCHFIVLEGFSKKKVFINDPAHGPISYTRSEFEKGYSGIVITVDPGAEFQKTPVPPSFWKKLKEEWLQKPGALLFFLFLHGALFVIPSLFIPMVLRIFVDHVYLSNVYFWKVELLVFLFFTISTSTLLFASYRAFIYQLARKISTRTSSQFLGKLLQLPLAFYQQRDPKEMARRVELHRQITQTLIVELIPAAIQLFFSFFFILIMFLYDPLLASVTLTGALLCLVAMKVIYHLRKADYASYEIAESKMKNMSLGDLSSLDTIKVVGSESFFFNRWTNFYTQMVNREQRVGEKGIWLKIFPFFTLAFSSALLLATGSEKILVGELSLGMLMAMQLYLLLFLLPLNTFVNLLEKISALKRNQGVIEDIVHTYREKGEREFLPERSFSGRVEFQNVAYSHYPSSPPLWTDLSFVCKPGEWLGICGPTASGKSTLGKLAAALIHPTEGKILYDNSCAHDFNRDQLHRSIGWADQDVYLFHATYQENLTYGNPPISLPQLEQACKETGLWEFISQKKQSLQEEIVEEGKNISATEKQLIEITRLFLKNPPLFILDDCLNILTPENKKNLLHHLRLKKATCVFITHEENLLRLCDTILTLPIKKGEE